MKHLKSKLFWASLATLFLIPLFFQNCARVNMSSEPSLNINKSLQNGGPYGGLFKTYRYYSSVQPCSSQDLNGKALPNTEILFKPDSQGLTAPFLSRESCQDLKDPSRIADSDLQITDSSYQTVTYKNFVMTSQNLPGDFDVVAGQCPAGKTEIAGALRTNYFVHSLDWMVLHDPNDVNSPAGWYIYPGIASQLYSTIQSLPAFLIARNDASLLDDYRRHSQTVQLKASTAYVLSFVAQAGSVAGTDVFLYRGYSSTAYESAKIHFNFQNGTGGVEYQTNMNGLSVSMTPFAGGYLCNIYFNSSATANQTTMDIGFTPTTGGQGYGQVGDSMIATAAQLVETSSFCR